VAADVWPLLVAVKCRKPWAMACARGATHKAAANCTHWPNRREDPSLSILYAETPLFSFSVCVSPG
jgi:hypothetical protein